MDDPGLVSVDVLSLFGGIDSVEAVLDGVDTYTTSSMVQNVNLPDGSPIASVGWTALSTYPRRLLQCNGQHLMNDRITYAQVLSNDGNGTLTADIEGETYGPGVALNPELGVGDLTPVGFLNPHSRSRQPVDLGPGVRMYEFASADFAAPPRHHHRQSTWLASGLRVGAPWLTTFRTSLLCRPAAPGCPIPRADHSQWLSIHCRQNPTMEPGASS